jgi:hypothetical protein
MEKEKIGVKFIATVTGSKGVCHANHKAGQKFELNRMFQANFVELFDK